MRNFFKKYGSTDTSTEPVIEQETTEDVSGASGYCQHALDNVLEDLNTVIRVANDISKHNDSINKSYLKGLAAGLDDVDMLNGAIAILIPYARATAENAINPANLVSDVGYTLEEATELAPVMARDTINALGILFTLITAGEISGTRMLILDKPDTEAADAIR